MVKKLFQIDLESAKPKYRQLMDAIVEAVDRKRLKQGDRLPSINQLSAELHLSRDTVMFALGELKTQGLVRSQRGKGYYVSTSEVQHMARIFILFDEWNALKEELYNSLIVNLKGRAYVDIFFHHFNPAMFKSLIMKGIGHYSYFVVMPGNFAHAPQVLYKIPRNRLFILGRFKSGWKNYPTLYQDYESDYYEAMCQGIELLRKYRKLLLIHPDGGEPRERVRGFERFCKENKFEFEVANNLDGLRPALYEAYFLISDGHLVELLKWVKRYNYKLGKKFGIVSFHDSSLKEIAAGGITTISPDYAAMGETLAGMLLNRSTNHFRNPSKLIVRNSL